MSFLEKIILFLQGTMVTPTAYGWFHIMWIFITLLAVIFLSKIGDKNNEKQTKAILLTYGVIALILELLKQIIWSFNYDPITNLVTWNYEWYSFPFQLCTTPIYVSIICPFVKNKKTKEALLSYMAFITILGSIATIIMPDSCFVEDILVNIHTMWLHCGSFVVSIYLLISNVVAVNIENLKKAIITFLVFVVIALTLNIFIYNIGILEGETFNMFFISPYFESTLPVFNIIYKYVPYIIFLIIYICIIELGAVLVYLMSLLIKKMIHKINNKKIKASEKS